MGLVHLGSAPKLEIYHKDITQTLLLEQGEGKKSAKINMGLRSHIHCETSLPQITSLEVCQGALVSNTNPRTRNLERKHESVGNKLHIPRVNVSIERKHG